MRLCFVLPVLVATTLLAACHTACLHCSTTLGACLKAAVPFGFALPAARASPPPPPPPPAGRPRLPPPAAAPPPPSAAAVDPGPPPSVKLRTFFWDRLPAGRVAGTFWEAHPPDYSLLDRPAVEALFQAAIRRPGSAGSARQAGGEPGTPSPCLPGLGGATSPPGMPALLVPACAPSAACCVCSLVCAPATACQTRFARPGVHFLPLQRAPQTAAPGAGRPWRRWTLGGPPTLVSSWPALGRYLKALPGCVCVACIRCLPGLGAAGMCVWGGGGREYVFYVCGGAGAEGVGVRLPWSQLAGIGWVQADGRCQAARVLCSPGAEQVGAARQRWVRFGGLLQHFLRRLPAQSPLACACLQGALAGGGCGGGAAGSGCLCQRRRCARGSAGEAGHVLLAAFAWERRSAVGRVGRASRKGIRASKQEIQQT